MKKTMFNLSSFALLIMSIFTLSGCEKKFTTVSYTDEKSKVSISIGYPDNLPCNFSTDSKDFRTSAENAILISDNFKIALDIVSRSFKGDFEKEAKQEGLNRIDGKEVTFNNLSGVSFYYAPYNRYNVRLPINDKCYLEIHIYSTKTEYKKEFAEEVFNSEEVKEILNTIEIKSN